MTTATHLQATHSRATHRSPRALCRLRRRYVRPRHGIDVRIADLGGTTLGLASGNTIWLDDNAAGWGWFVDPTPGDDSEFTTPGDQGEQGKMN